MSDIEGIVLDADLCDGLHVEGCHAKLALLYNIIIPTTVDEFLLHHSSYTASWLSLHFYQLIIHTTVIHS